MKSRISRSGWTSTTNIPHQSLAQLTPMNIIKTGLNAIRLPGVTNILDEYRFLTCALIWKYNDVAYNVGGILTRGKILILLVKGRARTRFLGKAIRFSLRILTTLRRIIGRKRPIMVKLSKCRFPAPGYCSCLFTVIFIYWFRLYIERWRYVV
jgi:hypothetical protein